VNNAHVIIIFVDGLGIGADNPDFNPCCYSETGIFKPDNWVLPYGGTRYALDACLDVSGLPQSATGQTSIYTGKNAAMLIGKHLFGFPNQILRELLQKHSLFVKLTQLGYRCKFINAFRPIFFTTPELFKKMRMSATTEMNRAANLPFASFQDLRNKQALYHDYSNQILIAKGFDVQEISAHQAAGILARISETYDVTLYEYFMTDYAGHAQDMEFAIKEIKKLELLLVELLQILNFEKNIVLLVSDHGNIEDLRTKSHTLNPAYMALWGEKNTIKFDSVLSVYPYLFKRITGKKAKI
jgi:2,3-bisphosphoglycerate-independent phosphoglycerate mutase